MQQIIDAYKAPFTNSMGTATPAGTAIAWLLAGIALRFVLS